MKPLTIQVNDLIEFKENEEVVFAYCSKTNRKMTISLNGNFKLYKNNELKYEVMQPYQAVELFNNKL